MLWLAFYLKQLPLEALATRPAMTGTDAEPRPPCAVTMQLGARRWVIAADDPALVGVDWASARTRHPDLRALERRPRAERDAMQAFATWAWAYGSELVLDIAEPERSFGVPCAVVWVEIGASLKLYGGLDALLADVARRGEETGHQLRIGVAPTLEAAALFAIAGRDRPILDPAALPAALSALPLEALRLDVQTEAALQAVGLTTIGELLALPPAAVAKRHGRSLIERLDRLLGRRPEVRPRWQPPNRFQRRFDLLGEVEHAEGLLFPLQRMTRELARYLNVRDTGLQGFHLTLSHGRASGGARRPNTELVLRLSTSTRDPERLLRVLRERLARMPLPAPVRGLKLVADQFIEPAAGQRDLFDAGAGEDEAWSQLIEKLVARLGTEAVGALGLVADHRPEQGGAVLACEAVISGAVSAASVPAQSRPIWLIDPPKPLPSRPALLEGCERIEGGWWDGGDVMRDYYRAELGGGRFWVYRDRRSDGWYLQGVWA